METWFLLLETIFVTPNKVLDITNNQMLISNIWIFRMNDGYNNQKFIPIILIIRPRLAFVDSNYLIIIKHQPANYKLCFLSEEKLFSLIVDLIKTILAAFISSLVRHPWQIFWNTIYNH